MLKMLLDRDTNMYFNKDMNEYLDKYPVETSTSISTKTARQQA